MQTQEQPSRRSLLLVAEWNTYHAQRKLKEYKHIKNYDYRQTLRKDILRHAANAEYCRKQARLAS